MFVVSRCFCLLHSCPHYITMGLGLDDMIIGLYYDDFTWEIFVIEVVICWNKNENASMWNMIDENTAVCDGIEKESVNGMYREGRSRVNSTSGIVESVTHATLEPLVISWMHVMGTDLRRLELSVLEEKYSLRECKKAQGLIRFYLIIILLLK